MSWKRLVSDDLPTEKNHWIQGFKRLVFRDIGIAFRIWVFDFSLRCGGKLLNIWFEVLLRRDRNYIKLNAQAPMFRPLLLHLESLNRNRFNENSQCEYDRAIY